MSFYWCCIFYLGYYFSFHTLDFLWNKENRKGLKMIETLGTSKLKLCSHLSCMNWASGPHNISHLKRQSLAFMLKSAVTDANLWTNCHLTLNVQKWSKTHAAIPHRLFLHSDSCIKVITRSFEPRCDATSFVSSNIPGKSG